MWLIKVKLCATVVFVSKPDNSSTFLYRLCPAMTTLRSLSLVSTWCMLEAANLVTPMPRLRFSRAPSLLKDPPPRYIPVPRNTDLQMGTCLLSFCCALV